MAPTFDSHGSCLDRRDAGGNSVAGERRAGSRRVGDKKMNRILLRLSHWNWIPYLVLAALGSWWAFDAFVPVVRWQGELVSRDADGVVVRLSGAKLRECKYINIMAYSRTAAGLNRDTVIHRVDMPAQSLTKPLGTFDMGFWDIRPVKGASSVVVYVQHACDADDLRTTKLAEVKLP